MTTKTVSLARFAREMRVLGPRLEKAVVRGLRSAALRMPEIVKQELESAQPYPAVTTGELARSAKVDKTDRGAIVGMDAPHAAFIEEGTRPHWPPQRPIKDWARMKFPGKTEEELDAIAFMVARKISIHGTAPRWYFKAALARMSPIIEAEIRAEIEEELAK